MKKEEDELEKMILVATDYYEKNKSQAEIARELGLSRPTVSRLLNTARKEKIVRIEIIHPNRINKEAGTHLASALQIKNAVIVSGHSPSPGLTRKNIAFAAANYLMETLKPGETLGLGWGRTIKELAGYLQAVSLPELMIVPLLGGVGQVNSAYQSQTIVQAVAETLQARYFQLHIPAVFPGKELKPELLSLPESQGALGYWNQMSTAVIGIGVSPLEDQFLFYDYVGELERIHLSKEGAVGDICLRFFDVNGMQIEYEGQECISIELEMLRKTESVIAVAAGKEKARGIIGASRAKVIKTLVTDENTANAIFDALKDKP